MTESRNNTVGWAAIVAGLRPVSSGVQSDGKQVLTTDIPDHWKQGRTAYGGVMAGLLLETALRREPDLPPLRSALIHFVGPVSEAPHLGAQILRQGRNVTSVAAQAASPSGETVGTASFAFGASRASKVRVTLPAPDAPSPDACAPFTPEPMAHLVPAFFHNFDTRLIDGSRPMMGETGYIRCWTRHIDPDSRNSPSRTHAENGASLLCLADVLPPAALPLLRTMAPVSSMSWIVNLLSDAPTTQDGWWQIETRLSAAQDGYSSQLMRIWNRAGDLVVEGMQSVAIFD